MRADKLDHPCRLHDISTRGAAVSTPTVVAVGENIIVYFLHLGGIEGSVVRRFEGGFAMSFSATQRKREKLAAQILRLSSESDISEAEERQYSRAPSLSLSTLVLPDGTALECPTLDVSHCGASIVTPIRPPLGTQVVFASQAAAVVRHHDEGIAIEFVNQRLTEDAARDRFSGGS